jgi:hypothetical protein
MDHSRTLIDAIRDMLSIGEPMTSGEDLGEVHGRVRRRLDGRRDEEFEIWTSMRFSCWQVSSPAVKEVRTYNPIDGLRAAFGSSNEDVPVRVGRTLPILDAAALVMPRRLSIWGRLPVDRWRMVSAEKRSRDTVVQLLDLYDPSIAGELRLNEAGLPVSLAGAGESLELVEWEPLAMSDYQRFWWGESRHRDDLR